MSAPLSLLDVVARAVPALPRAEGDDMLPAGAGLGESMHLPALPGSQDEGLFHPVVARRPA